ncbi:MAG: hypothetical protein KAI47_00075 [Deltaproteobacteria bacterium]|nr:hypothetical protein [Deltaproteobacteria bacterium]
MVIGLRGGCAGAALMLFFGGVTGCRFFADYPLEKPPPDATLSETSLARDSYKPQATRRSPWSSG